MKTINEITSLIKNHVEEYVEKNKSLLPYDIAFNDQSIDHIKNIAVSVMQTKWGVGYEGGSFSKAVAENNLVRSFANADDTNRNALYLYVRMIQNLDMPMEVYEYKKSLNS